ncbi:Hypothetical predicted protein, partial [Pelobates cultripes]
MQQSTIQKLNVICTAFVSRIVERKRSPLIPINCYSPINEHVGSPAGLLICGATGHNDTAPCLFSLDDNVHAVLHSTVASKSKHVEVRAQARKCTLAVYPHLCPQDGDDILRKLGGYYGETPVHFSLNTGLTQALVDMR